MPDKGLPNWLPLAMLLALSVPAARGDDDSRPLSLQHLTTRQGLPQGTVMATLQDSQGFIWLATEDGLIRYDGYDLVRYAYQRQNSQSLPGNFVRDIVEDRSGNVWVAIKDGGVARWDRSTDKFTSFKHDPANNNSLASNVARALLLDARGRLWIGLQDAGIDILDPSSGRIEHLRHGSNDATSLIDDRVNTLTLDRHGAIWAGTESGLTRFAAQTKRGEQFRYADGNVSRILEDRSDRLWIGFFNGGLAEIDHAGKLRRRFVHDARAPHSLANNDVRALLEDQAGRLWIGTADGLSLLDAERGEFSHFRRGVDQNNSLTDSYVMSLYEDRSGLVWIGTRAGGVSRWNPHSWEMGGHRPAWLTDAIVTSFADAADGKIWIGSIGSELSRFDPQTGKSMPISALLGRSATLRDQRVMALLTDRRGTLWIGTMTGGLLALQPDGRLETIPVGKGFGNGTSAAGIMSLYEARDGKIWIGTYGGGANILDANSRLVRQLPFNGNGDSALSGANVSAFAEDADGNLWIATDGGGLNLTDNNGHLIRSFRHDSANASGLASNTLYALAADGNGRIWIGTDGGGLDQVIGSSREPRQILFRNWSRADGLSSDTVYGLLADAKGRLWLSGNAGLTRFDPNDGSIKTFHTEHGLQGEEFNFNAYFKSRSGVLAFGGTGGFNIFDPGKLTERSIPPRIAMTRLEVMGAPVLGETPWWLAKNIELAADANIVNLAFAALDFTSPTRNRLSYRMRGLSDDWIDFGASNRITLTNLDAGEHLLEVRAANADSVWSAEPFTLTIRKAAPLWRSQWAYVAYALLIGALLLYRARRNQRRLQQAVAARQRLETEVANRTQELRESNLQLTEAAQVKEGFLARMSHELRTPMNGVIGMSDLLATTSLSATQRQYTNTIRASAQTLLRILNDLLDISKINAGKIQLEAAPLNVKELVEECALLFSGACRQKNLQLSVVTSGRTEVILTGDALRIRQILMNLIGNAVKFTQLGTISVTGHVTLRDAQRADVEFEIRDTGIGIDSKSLGTIFEPFAQADETTARRFGGTGLGLTICRELAQLMGGRIEVHSEPHCGSKFRVLLPLAIAAERTTPSTAGSPIDANTTPSTADSSPARVRGRVLIVEDDIINATVAEGYLQELNCKPVWVADGPSAFQRLGSEPFDMILMDLSMPGMDGFAATAALRHRMAGQRRIPIVALTAHDAATYRERCLAADMDDILSKPYTLSECAALIDRWLPHRASSQSSAPAPAPAPASAPAPAQSTGRDVALATVDSATVASVSQLSSGRQQNLYGRLVSLFAQSADARLAELRADLDADDFASAAALCHKLKSAAANVGALAYSNAVRACESACQTNDRELARRLSRDLERALPLLLDNLRDQTLKVSA